MSFLKRLAGTLAVLETAVPPNVLTSGNPTTQMIGMNRDATIYPSSNDDTFINEGYNRNAWIYSIISKCAKKFSQVNWYHYKINRSERKTWEEYMTLTKERTADPKARIEAMKMRKKAVEQVIVDDALSKFIAKPNRNQSGAMFREQLYGYKLLTGEGNQWFTRPTDSAGNFILSAPPLEMFIVPKNFLALVRGSDPWSIERYKLIFAGNQFLVPKENMLMWKFPNYKFDPIMLTHLRGQAPLDAGLLMLQATNEGAERLINMNKNQGVAGLAYNTADTRQWTPEQAMFNRRQFNSIVNDNDLAGTVAYMSGDWGFLQFGMNVEELKILEQIDKGIEWFCNVFDYPPGLLTKNQTYENQKQQERSFIYNNIAVASYGLRDEWNEKLIPEFGLDRNRDCIDCDIMGLPELSEDLKTQAETFSKLWQLTPNMVLERLGEDRSPDPNMDKHYIPANLIPLEQANQDMGTNLDTQMNLLNQ